MNKTQYKKYLKSDKWKKKREEFYSKDKRVKRLKKKFGKYVCVSCKSPFFMNIHHKTYQRLGKEKISDLILLCNSCHKRVHDYHKENKHLSLKVCTYKIMHQNWKNLKANN